AALGRAVRLDPGYHFAWDGLARVHLAQGRAAEAASAWAAAVEAAPEEVDLLVSWASALAAAERTDAALRVLHRATEVAPTSPRAWAQLGVLALVRHDLGTAGEALLEAPDLDPGNDEARYHLALLHLLVGAVEEAREALEALAAGRGPWTEEAADVLRRLAPGG